MDQSTHRVVGTKTNKRWSWWQIVSLWFFFLLAFSASTDSAEAAEFRKRPVTISTPSTTGLRRRPPPPNQEEDGPNSSSSSAMKNTTPDSLPPRGGAVRSPLVEDLLRRALIGFYFALWYALNIVYNSTYCTRERNMALHVGGLWIVLITDSLKTLFFFTIFLWFCCCFRPARFFF